ncbi:hypothetical protein HanRHA438_Chr09g0377671 [Helianthus annuus]|nr:hypothetical protein HanRHA438_Chr09g0377671 [Helianthus annuus]
MHPNPNPNPDAAAAAGAADVVLEPVEAVSRVIPLSLSSILLRPYQPTYQIVEPVRLGSYIRM